MAHFRPVASRPMLAAKLTTCAETPGSVRLMVRMACITQPFLLQLHKGGFAASTRTFFERKKLDEQKSRGIEVNFMNWRLATMNDNQSAANPESRMGAPWVMIAVLALAAAFPLLAQDSAIQEKMAAVKQAMAANAQKLHQYQWIETTQLTLKGDPKPPTQDSCQYGPDGTVQKTPFGPPPEQPSGGRLKERIIERKEEEIKEYMGQVK